MTRFIGLLSLVIAILGLGQAAEAQTRGGKMTYGRYADSLFLDPVLNDANVDIWVLTNLYDTLLAPTPDGQNVQPGLATKWDRTENGKSVFLSLRPNAKCADGTHLAAQDVK